MGPEKVEARELALASPGNETNMHDADSKPGSPSARPF